jgi:hypothetical protein
MKKYPTSRHPKTNYWPRTSQIYRHRPEGKEYCTVSTPGIQHWCSLCYDTNDYYYEDDVEL